MKGEKEGWKKLRKKQSETSCNSSHGLIKGWRTLERQRIGGDKGRKGRGDEKMK